MKEELKCDVCGCTEYETYKITKSKKFKMTLCSRHYMQLIKYGNIERTTYDPNEYVIYDDYAEILLYDVEGNEVSRTQIDIEDIQQCKMYKWGRGDRNYVYTKINGKRIGLHRFLLNVIHNDCIIDHIDRNPLNNRRKNLRICTICENGYNQSVHSNSSSGVTGVNWSNARNQWLVRIQVNGKRINIGYYDSFNEAVQIRKEAELKYFGEFAPI